MSTVLIEIERNYEEKQTKGSASLFINNQEIYKFKTLELPWLDNQRNISCIPEGEYKVVVRYSQKYKRHLHILDVNDRSFILIHWGNYAGSINPKTKRPDIRGCILTGDSYKDITGDGIDEILRSRSTFNTLMSHISDDDEITLQIA